MKLAVIRKNQLIKEKPRTPYLTKDEFTETFSKKSINIKTNQNPLQKEPYKYKSGAIYKG